MLSQCHVKNFHESLQLIDDGFESVSIGLNAAELNAATLIREGKRCTGLGSAVVLAGKHRAIA